MSRRFAVSSRSALALFIGSLLLVLVGLLWGGLLLGSAAAADDSPTLESRLSKLGYTLGEPVKSISDYRVDAWNYIDDQHVMIYTGVSRRALLTLQSRCPDLSSVERIGFSSTGSHLTKFDKIVVHGAGGMRRDCQISEIHQLNSTKTKAP